MNSKDFTFYSKRDYYARLTDLVNVAKTGDLITVASMNFNPEFPEVRQLTEALAAAAARGAKVHLLVDAFAFLISGTALPGPLLLGTPLRAGIGRYRYRLALLEELRSQGGHFTILNQPSRPLTNPMAGRSHIKFAAVNDYVFVGGCNLTASGELDLMVGWHDILTADYLRAWSKNVQKHGRVLTAMRATDTKFTVDKQTELLIDSGRQGQSLIFDQALELIDKAQESIFITCQFFPNDVTAQHLAAARARGVSVKIIYNAPGKHVKPLNMLHHGVVQFEKVRRPNELFSNQLPKVNNFLHAKLLVTDQGTLLGSHNYVPISVRLGTAEIAVLSRDPSFGSQAIAALKYQLL